MVDHFRTQEGGVLSENHFIEILLEKSYCSVDAEMRLQMPKPPRYSGKENNPQSILLKVWRTCFGRKWLSKAKSNKANSSEEGISQMPELVRK